MNSGALAVASGRFEAADGAAAGWRCGRGRQCARIADCRHAAHARARRRGCRGAHRHGSAERVRWRQRLNLNECGAGADHLQLCGGRIGQVDDAIGHERTAIIDAHDDAATIGEIGDARVAGQRQCLVRRSHRKHVVGLAGRGAQAVKLRAVPGGDAAFDIADAAAEYGVAAAENLVEGWIAERAARLIARYRIGNAAEVGRVRGQHRLGARRRRAGGQLRATSQ